MKRLVVIVALGFGFGCFHTTHVEKPDEQTGGQQQAAQPKGHEGGPAAKARAARRPLRPGRPPLAASPGGLLVPGGVQQIQKALAGRGYLDASESKDDDIDAATAAAIRKFQTDQGIARTGNPDHETVRRLGLDPDQIFRKSSAVKEEGKQ